MSDRDPAAFFTGLFWCSVILTIAIGSLILLWGPK